MASLTVEPQLMSAAAADVAKIGSAICAAKAVGVGPTTSLAVAAGPRVSAVRPQLLCRTAPLTSVYDRSADVNGDVLTEGDTSADSQTSTADLAVKLNKLFEIMRRPSEPPLSNAAAAAAITEKTGVSISAAYLWQLRTGLKTNPTVTHLRAIAEFFGVSASYLIDAGVDEKVDAQLNLLQALRDAGVRDLAMRASGLTPAALTNLMAMVDHVRELEKLPPVMSTPGDPDGGP
jgi:transcriptional regulator with XRE-family HTH domain